MTKRKGQIATLIIIAALMIRYLALSSQEVLSYLRYCEEERQRSTKSQHQRLVSNQEGDRSQLLPLSSALSPPLLVVPSHSEDSHDYPPSSSSAIPLTNSSSAPPIRRAGTSSADFGPSPRHGHRAEDITRVRRSRDGWCSNMDPMFIGIATLQMLVFTYFIVSTEMLIHRKNHSDTSNESWGFGQASAVNACLQCNPYPLADIYLDSGTANSPVSVHSLQRSWRKASSDQRISTPPAAQAEHEHGVWYVITRLN